MIRASHFGSTPYRHTIVDDRLESKSGEIEAVHRIVELRAKKTTLADRRVPHDPECADTTRWKVERRAGEECP